MLAHPAAETDKGAGIAMCCTFGDLTDVIWWRELQLPTRAVIGRDGRILRDDPGVAHHGRRPRAVRAARRQDDVLGPRGDRGGAARQRRPDGEPTATQRMANFYEKGDKPLEIVTSRQWYIRNGGRDEALKATLVERGHELHFVPGVHGAPLRELGQRPERRLADQPAALLRRAVPGLVPARRRRRDPTTPTRSCADESALPVDPSSDPPPGFTDDQRGVPGGFIGDPDVMDTWATSSLTPQIVGGWERDPDLFARVFPMDLSTARPRDHPHLAVLPRRARALRERLAAVEALDDQRLRGRPGPQEDEQVQGQRHRADRDPRAVRHGRRALARRDGPPGHGLARSTRAR